MVYGKLCLQFFPVLHERVVVHGDQFYVKSLHVSSVPLALERKIYVSKVCGCLTLHGWYRCSAGIDDPHGCPCLSSVVSTGLECYPLRTTNIEFVFWFSIMSRAKYKHMYIHERLVQRAVMFRSKCCMQFNRFQMKSKGKMERGPSLEICLHSSLPFCMRSTRLVFSYWKYAYTPLCLFVCGLRDWYFHIYIAVLTGRSKMSVAHVQFVGFEIFVSHTLLQRYES
jgi:hypothetical protein